MAGHGTALAFSPAARELKSGAFVTWGARIATQATQCLYLVPFEKEPALSFGPFDASELPYMVPMEKTGGVVRFRGGSRSQAHLSLSLAVCPGSTGGILGSVGPLCSFQGPL